MIAFEAKQVTDAVGVAIEKAAKLIEMSTDSIVFVLKRRYLHIDCACEVFTHTNRSRFFVFRNQGGRNEFFKKLRAMKPKRLQFIQTGDAAQAYTDLKLHSRWNSGALSNYEYIYWLNMLSGRSIHDLSQYPVFPWVISDYESDKLDFFSAAMYRDLGKPMGAMNEERIAQLRFLFIETIEQPYACLYRFHYSAPAYVIGFLIRREPFTSLHIQLQNGRFDHPNRLFFSVKDAWKAVTSPSPDFRELIPEFYANPEFLMNTDNFDFGLRVCQGKTDPEPIETRVHDVELPAWSASASAFVALNRIALESAFVSAHLHEWIDLIFGVKQQSEAYDNYFHPWSSYESIDEDPSLVPVIQQHASNFGITPSKLFKTAHTPRKFRPVPHRLFSSSELFLKETHCETFGKQLVRLSMSQNSLLGLFVGGELALFNIPPKQAPVIARSVQLDIASDLSTNRVLSVPSRFGVLIAPRWSPGFTLFSVNRRRFVPAVTHSTPISALAVDSHFCVSAASDSSILVWNLETELLVTAVVAHTSGIAAVAILAKSEMLVSCDISGLLVFSALKTGDFIQKTDLGRVPSRILLSDLGFCLLVFDHHLENGVQTDIVLTDFAGRQLASRELEGICTAASLMVNEDASEFFVLAQETNIVYILNVWNLNTVAIGPVSGNVRDMAFSPAEVTLHFLLENGELRTATFA
jgi:hypothetical protein